MKGFGSLPGVALLAELRDKYWFLPGISALMGLVAGIGLVAIDNAVGSQWLGNLEALHGSRPEGARAMLSTIAGSTITVAGVVFSITLAAVTYASGQHGPRLLTNFARDTGNQLTLGVFIGTYVYCLVVLRTIRSAGEDASASAFVPHIAVYGALALALSSIGVLIYFFHHVTETIHINNVIARIGRKLIERLRRHGVDTEAAGPGSDARPAAGYTVAVVARRTGYVESIAHQDLARMAAKLGLCVQLCCRPGDFVLAGTALMEVAEIAGQPGLDKAALAAAVAIGDRRTDLQDLRFGFDELTEIAIRALSPGINDPFTAVACIDWLTAALRECEQAFAGSIDFAGDGTGALRTQPLAFDDFVAASFGRLRQHVAAEAMVKAAASNALLMLAANARTQPIRLRLLS